MSQRSDVDIGRILCPRNNQVHYGGGESDSEDYVEDQASNITEVSCDEEEISEFGRDKYKWCLETPKTRRSRSSRKLHLPGARGNSMNANSPYESWNSLISNGMLEIILKWTNAEI